MKSQNLLLRVKLKYVTIRFEGPSLYSYYGQYEQLASTLCSHLGLKASPCKLSSHKLLLNEIAKVL